MEKYRMKEQEAQMLSDFIMPMLEYYPEKRVSAQELLKHHWLNMPADFDYLMSDREYEKMMMIKKNAKKEKNSNLNSNEDNIKQDLVESDVEKNMADDEDNEEISVEDDSDDSFVVDNPDQIHIQNFNNSFAAYGQHVNLAALDRANPQFDKIF
jgi:serine/threonine protein kinase